MKDYSCCYADYVALLTDRIEKDAALLFAEGSSVGEAARYSLLSGGKRVRGVLVLAVCDLLGGQPQVAAGFAAAIEMLHCYSLIHDDLPCMDNADLRRGKPSCHKVYGEATALLAGDALLTAAFEELARAGGTAVQTADATLCLAKAAGPTGMVYGQELDLAFEHQTPQQSDLMKIHQHKTGDLINAAATLGAISADADATTVARIREYSARIGLVFQIIDDLLDVTATPEELGKPVGNDAVCGKTTFATLAGIPAAEQQATDLTGEACALLEGAYGEKSAFLTEFAHSLLLRKK